MRSVVQRIQNIIFARFCKTAVHGHNMGTPSACITRICWKIWGTFPPWNRLWGHFWPQIPFIQSYLYAHFTSTWNLQSYLIFDLSFPHYFYLGNSEFYMGRGQGVATPLLFPPSPSLGYLYTKKVGSSINLCQAKLIVTLPFLSVLFTGLCPRLDSPWTVAVESGKPDFSSDSPKLLSKGVQLV